MGSCLSKSSPKGPRKRENETPSAKDENTEGPEQQNPWKEVSEVEGKKASQATLTIAAPAPPPSAFVENWQLSPTASRSPLPHASKSTEFEKIRHAPASPLLQKPSLSPSFSPDPVILPSSGQTRLKHKHSGVELIMNPHQKPSSPSNSMLPNMPPSPGFKRYAQKSTDEEGKFPSLARKQWLSQAFISEIISSTNKGAECVTGVDKLVGKEAPTLASKRPCAQVTVQTSKKCDAKVIKVSMEEPPNLTGITVTSRTNSFPRDLSPVEPSQAKARPSSPLKRSPSIKDSAADAPLLTRSASGRMSSPHRSGFNCIERHDSMKTRTQHKQILSKELLADPCTDGPVHKRCSNRDSNLEFCTETIRKPSPPKKAPGVVNSSISIETNMLTARRPSTPNKDNLSLHRSINQDSSSMGRAGRSSAQKSLSVNELDSTATSNNIRNTRRREKSPLRRTCNVVPVLQSNTRMADHYADLSISMGTTVGSHFEGKDVASKSKKLAIRTPLKEICDNFTHLDKATISKQGANKSVKTAVVPREDMTGQIGKAVDDLREELTKSYQPLGKCSEKAILNMASGFTELVKDPLEVKAENLVMEGKSVLSAFKALEEYRLKYSNINLELHKGGDEDEDLEYSRHQYSHGIDKEGFSQPLQGSKTTERLFLKDNTHQQPQDLLISRSTKKSCEHFLFPDVQSLRSSEKYEGMQLEGGMAMPASISKACSILRAVADLNMGASTYSKKKKEVPDEIERPNFSSFQFGQGENQ